MRENGVLHVSYQNPPDPETNIRTVTERSEKGNEMVRQLEVPKLGEQLGTITISFVVSDAKTGEVWCRSYKGVQ